MPEIDSLFGEAPGEYERLSQAETYQELWRKAMLFGSAVMKVTWDKEQHMAQKFKVGDRIVFLKWLPSIKKWSVGDQNVQAGLAGKIGILEQECDLQEWKIRLEDGQVVQKGSFRFELAPQFKKGDKLRLVDSNCQVYGEGPWYVYTVATNVDVSQKPNPPWSTYSFLASSFEPWEKQEQTSMSDEERKLAEQLIKRSKAVTDNNPLVQHCAICNKEYTNINDVRDIIGGGVLDGPVKADGKQNEEMVLGPCCYLKTMEFLMQLKTRTNPITERKMQTNSWMPHDIDGDM